MLLCSIVVYPRHQLGRAKASLRPAFARRLWQTLRLQKQTMQPSVKKIVLYLWLTTFLLLALFSTVKQLLGAPHMFGGEFLWLFIAPGIVGWLYRKKYKQNVPEETAKRVANYFVASLMLSGLAAVAAYANHNWSLRLSERATFLVVAVAIYCVVLWFFGRWVVTMGLNNYGRNAKTEP